MHNPEEHGRTGQRPTRSVEGERRIVTILFCDVKGSTAMAEHLDPEEWAEVMNEAFQYLIQPVYRYEGTVARLMGDAILAFFGAPVAHEDDPVRAVLAALDIVDGIQPFADQIRREYGMDFNVRVGINTGPVVVGEVGSELAGEYTAMGDAVNLAARMEEAAGPGAILLAEDTYRLVEPLFDFEPLGSIEARGKSEPVMAYRVLGRKLYPGSLRGIEGLASPLVGRRSELDALRRAFDELRLGRGQILALIGEAGLGKSRLLEELRAYAREHTVETIPWVESRGISYDVARPYGLFQQHVRQFSDLHDGDTPEIVRAKVSEGFKNFDPEIQETIIRATELMLFSRTGPDGPPLEGEALKDEIFSCVLTVFRESARANPLVMVFDDLHWSDAASVELLIHLFQLADQVPVLFLCAFRPYRSSPAWKAKIAAETDYPHRYTQLNLSPLSAEESGVLIDNLLSISELPEELRQAVLRKAEGNPFFIEEVVRTLIESGLVHRDESGMHWQASPQAATEMALSIPDTLQALLLARIDRLEKEARRTLQLASVIGRSFYYRVLQAIADMQHNLDKQLLELQRAELIREGARWPELEYMFRHELTRDAAYNSILRRQRRLYHRTVGETIENLFPDRLEEEAHRLAYHFEQALEAPKALKYYRLAGDKAARLYANQEAADHYRGAISFARRLDAPGEELVYLYTRMGRTMELTQRYDRALGCYRELYTLGQERGDRGMQLAALIPQATIFALPTSSYDPKEGKQLALEALGMARELGDHQAEARALWNMMLIEMFSTSDYAQAVAYGEQSIAIARQHGLKEALAYSLNDIVRPYRALQRNEEADTAGREAQQLWRELNNLPMLSDSLATAAEVSLIRGEIEQGLAYALEGMQVSQSIHNLWGESYNQFSVGMAFLEMGDIDAGLEALASCMERADQAQFLAGGLSARLFLAWAYLVLGDAESAVEMGEQLSKFGEMKVNLGREHKLWQTYQDAQMMWKAFIAFHTGDVRRTKEILEQMGDENSVEGSEFFYAPMLYLLYIEVALEKREYDHALELARNIQVKMRAAGYHLLLPDLLQTKARALLGLGRATDAYQSLLRARAIARQQGSRRSLYSILVDLLRVSTALGEPLPPPEVTAGEEEQTLSPAIFLAEARETLDYILSHISDPGLRAAFLSRPGLREILER
jgi:class 3 adenylate cyclase/tetratricopeptide (TPR) repeat protein